MNRLLSVLAVLLLVSPPGLAQQKAGNLKQQLVGTWSLVAQYVDQNGKRVERFGSTPKGIYMFDRNGRFAAILLRSDLPKIAANNAMMGTVEENKAIVQGSTAFYGKWSINEKDGSVTSHVDGSTYPNWDGQDQKRVVTISGDDLKICIPGGSQIGGTVCTVWKRAK